MYLNSLRYGVILVQCNLDVILQLENLQPPVEGLPIICHSGHGYNELLYAHLLDGDGQRLTYTHFTAKVNWNSMIEITFNRSVRINANKVYRIGMVLNKVNLSKSSHIGQAFFNRLVGILWGFVREGSTVRGLSSHSVLDSQMILLETDSLDQLYFPGNLLVHYTCLMY